MITVIEAELAELAYNVHDVQRPRGVSKMQAMDLCLTSSHSCGECYSQDLLPSEFVEAYDWVLLHIHLATETLWLPVPD